MGDSMDVPAGAVARPRPPMGRGGSDAERVFYVGMIAAMFALVLWGFARSFFLRGLILPQPVTPFQDRSAAVRWLFVLHGSLFTCWMALLLAQALLVGAGRRALHRAIGRKAYWLVGAMVVVGLTVGTWGGLHGFHVPVDRVSFSAVPYVAIICFAIPIVIGLNERRDLQRHKRLMLLGTMEIVGAGTARIAVLNALFPVWFDATLLLLIPLVGWDLATQRRVLPVTWRWGLFVIVTDLGALPLGMTPFWHMLMAPLLGSAK